MIAVFTTDVYDRIQVANILEIIAKSFPELNINFDLDHSDAPYPCGHTILRAEGSIISSDSIIGILHQSGFRCAVLEDKICK